MVPADAAGCSRPVTAGAFMGWSASMSGAAEINPAAERNKDPILAVLRRVLPSCASEGGEGAERPLVLEVASGTG